MKKTFKTLLIVSLTMIGLFVFSGCHTFEGMGQDVEALGESIQNVGD